MLPMTGANRSRRIKRALAGVFVARICWRKERDWGFWLREEGRGKGGYGRWEAYCADGGYL